MTLSLEGNGMGVKHNLWHAQLRPARVQHHQYKMHTQWLGFGLVLMMSLLACTAWAFPPLQPYEQGRFRFQAPVGWEVSVDENQGSILISEDPTDDDASVLGLVTAVGQDPLTLINTFINSPDLARFRIIEIGREGLVPNSLDALWLLVSLENPQDSLLEGYISFIGFRDVRTDTSILAFFIANAERFETQGGAVLPLVVFTQADTTMFVSTPPDPSPSFPTLVPYQGTVKLPEGWLTQYDAASGKLLAQEDMSDVNSPSLLGISVRDQGVAPVVALEQLLVSTGFEQINILSEDVLGGDGRIRVIDAVSQGEPVRSVFAVFRDANTGTLNAYGFGARRRRFDELGGVDLLMVTLGGLELTQLSRVNIPENSSANTGIYNDLIQFGQAYQQEFMQNALVEPLQPQPNDLNPNSLALQQMMLDTQQQMFNSWSNNLGGSDWCWADSYGTCF
ncbi:MAG: hypothetical protein AAF267_07565 [Deinococcota bacterium]